MRPLYTVIVSEEAARAFDEVKRWRAENLGPARAVEFADEFAAALQLLSRFPEIAALAPGSKRGTFSKSVRRFVLDATGYHFSYRVRHAAELVMIRRLWHRKGRPPRM
jgi:plasmid stabilization system protein ParE